MVDTINDLISGLQTYVVSPLNAFGLGGFIFDVEAEDMAILGADITDHYTEDNKALQDHIAIKPKRITLKGFVGELTYAPSGGGVSPLQSVTQKLTIISNYLPQISAAAQQAQEVISGASSADSLLTSFSAAVPAASNIYGLIKNAIGVTASNTAKQQAAYQYFAACQEEAILMGIQTPWEFLTNMAIETIVAIQPEDSIFMTDFAITFKQIRIADSISVAVSALSGTGSSAVNPSGAINGQGAYASQIAAPAQIGTIQGASAPLVNLSNPLNNPLGAAFQYVTS